MADDEDDAVTPDEEQRLFDEAMRDVRRIAPRNPRVLGRIRPPARPVSPDAPAPNEPFLAVEMAGEQVSAFDASVSKAVRRVLRQGSMEIEARLDLHGLRAAEAEVRLGAFVQESRNAGRRCVLVVTGRGLRSGPIGPVLREQTVGQLTAGPLARGVLGVVTAPPALGGAGALLVLLRKL